MQYKWEFVLTELLGGKDISKMTPQRELTEKIYHYCLPFKTEVIASNSSLFFLVTRMPFPYLCFRTKKNLNHEPQIIISTAIEVWYQIQIKLHACWPHECKYFFFLYTTHWKAKGIYQVLNLSKCEASQALVLLFNNNVHWFVSK